MHPSAELFPPWVRKLNSACHVRIIITRVHHVSAQEASSNILAYPIMSILYKEFSWHFGSKPSD